MLFSQPALAAHIQTAFEPAWQSVRPVPRITIDFGAGRVIERTLHGNIATYVCAPDGRVLDVIAGIYDPVTYRTRLDQARNLAAQYAGWDEPERVDRLRTTHAIAAAVGQSAFTDGGARPDQRKFATELGSERVLRSAEMNRQSPQELEIELARTLALRAAALLPARIPAVDVTDDAAFNERVRRPKVHALLAAAVGLTPGDLTARIYRDVLGTDLDDPYLGLSDTLFGGYPFER